ncbi:MAG: hypothetical protein HOH33_15760 [Verrucomicrobia bacterium]|nr:hypothetical protein [Verrucomicrobiota bacterium]
MAADTRSLLALVIGIGLFYFLALAPLDEKVNALNVPLEESWAKLGDSIKTNQLGGALDIHAMNELAATMESAFLSFTDAEADLISRILLPEETQIMMGQSFQLVEYQNDLVALEEQLKGDATANKVRLESLVFEGLPRHDVALDEPQLLWADLAFARYLLSLAIECQLDSIDNFETLNSAAVNKTELSEQHRLHRSRFRMNIRCDMSEAQQFLTALPLRGDEAVRAGLPMVHSDKPALFIERILLNKSTDASMNKMNLQLTVNGFIYHKSQKNLESE